MSYAIMEVIYGIPLVSSFKNMSDELENIVESQEYGLIKTRYSGHAEQIPTFCGVSIGSFTNCEPVIEMTDLTLTPTQAQIDEFNDSFHQMPEEVQKLIGDFGGQPRVFILSCTS